MFTGIVEEMGLVEGVRVSPFYQLRIKGRKILEGTKQADSIAVNGVCLTVIGVNEESFLVEVMPQTLNKTNLREVRKGDRVNLERSLSLTTRLGGHIVTGDIDGVGRIKSITRKREETVMEVHLPPSLEKYVVNQGRIALEGVSLTIASLRGDDFTVCLTPFTLENTTLGLRKEGDLVNLEVDIISKYIEKLVREGNYRRREISEEFLKKVGY
ncbi:riboflavin synthase [Candidatus Aerophobetes bacterium]|uniref:Riboflavin synthase n=1 Tax=Aerophobetes bacterium TaxID=2030807 RepID=A0A662CYU1_UNCAE|nr:MAG: riboflavin synthase [Candidatus Aerophobetes bacterium]